MSSPGDRDGLTSNDINYLKCWAALMKEGKAVFMQVFHWGFQGASCDIKKSLFQIYNYSNSRFRSDFDSLQRQKIEGGNLDEFDLNLFYLLIQRLCSLPQWGENPWSRDSLTTSLASLPTLLYRIKTKRNSLAHTKYDINDIRMNEELKLLEELFTKALLKAGEEYDVFSTEVNNFISKVSSRMNSIRSLKMENISIADEMKKVFADKLYLAASEGRAELSKAYDGLCKVGLASWSSMKSYQDVKDVFTEPTLKKNRHDILYHQLIEHEAIVNITDLLETTLPGNRIPLFIEIISPPGMGKTTLAKYILSSWIDGSNNIKGLIDIDIVIYIDCRTSKLSSFEDQISQLMPSTSNIFGSAELKRLIWSMETLIILDNLNELDKESLNSIHDIFEVNSDQMKIIVTSTEKILKTFSCNSLKPHLILQLEGISADQIQSCVSKMKSIIPKREEDDENMVKEFCSEYLLRANSSSTNRSHYSPEILTHVFAHWVRQKDNKVILSTRSSLFLSTYDLILSKILDKVCNKMKANIFERQLSQNRINSIFEKLFKCAYETLPLRPYVEFKDYLKLSEECQFHSVQHDQVLPEILHIEEIFDLITDKRLTVVSFPSSSLHIFYSALYIVNQIVDSEQSVSIILHDMELLSKNSENILQQTIFKFVVGILVFRKPLNFEQYISEVCSYIHENAIIVSTNQWLEIIEESKCNSRIMAEISIYMGPKWAVEDHHISRTLISLIRRHPPKNIMLTVCINPKELPHLKECLLECSSIAELDISLQLYYHFWVDKLNYSDEFLSCLFLNTNNIKLEHFAGKLSSSTLKMLPRNIKRLALHITPNEVPYLNDSLRNLGNLQLLYLNFDIKERTPPKSVPKLKIFRRETYLSVDLWNVRAEAIDWSCNVAAAFSPAYCRLVLRKTSLSHDDASRWLEGLRSLRVHSDSINIGSTVDINKEEEDNLRNISASFGCMEFNWIRI